MREKHQVATALARTRPAYAAQAMGHPASKLTLVTGLGLATMLASLTLAAVIFTVAASAAWIAAGSPQVRQHYDRQREERDRRMRNTQRHAKLVAAGVDPCGHTELTLLVETIETSDEGWTARRFQLDELLDRYIAVSIAHHRCLQAMHSVDRGALLRQLAAAPPMGGDASRCRRELLERRIACWDRCALQASRFEDELAAITDLIRLLAQRSACPDGEIDAELVAWRLAEIDAEDSALLQLAAAS